MYETLNLALKNLGWDVTEKYDFFYGACRYSSIAMNIKMSKKNTMAYSDILNFLKGELCIVCIRHAYNNNSIERYFGAGAGAS